MTWAIGYRTNTRPRSVEKNCSSSIPIEREKYRRRIWIRRKRPTSREVGLSSIISPFATPLVAAALVILRMVYIEDILGDRGLAETASFA
jgi:hypothetical protein